MKIYGQEEGKIVKLLNSDMFNNKIGDKKVKEVEIKGKELIIYFNNGKTEVKKLHSFYKRIKHELLPLYYDGKIARNITLDKLLNISLEQV